MIAMLLLFASSALAINASGTGYSIGTFGTAYQGREDSGTAYSERMQLNTNPVSDNATSPTYSARVGFFARPVIPVPTPPSTPPAGGGTAWAGAAGNQTGGTIRRSYIDEGSLTLAMDIIFVGGVVIAKRKAIYEKIAGV